MVPYARILVGAALLAGCAEEVEPPPVTFLAGTNSVRLDEDGSASVVLAAEVFNTSETLAYEIVEPPQLGQLVGSGAVYEYVGDENASGTDSFTWKAVAGPDESEAFTFDVFIAPINDAPRGQPASLVTTEDTPASDALAVTDVEGDELVFSIAQAPDFGTVDLGTDGTFTYTPNRNYVGVDFFLWSAQDPAGASTGPVRVDINVNEENDPPVVQSDGLLTQEDTPVNGQVVGSDPDGDDLTWTVVTQPTNGSLTFNSSFGSFTYSPDPDFFGLDSFEVVANDGAVDSAVSTIDITVTSVNDTPVVPPVTVNTSEDTPLVGTIVANDVEGQTLGFRIGQPPRKGTVSIDSATGEFTYTPNRDENGADDFTVIASDTTSDSLPGRITVAIAPVNDAPTLSNVGLLSTDEDVPVAGIVSGRDAEGDTLNYTLSTPPSNGSVTVSPVTGALVYQPALNFEGTDQFGVTATDTSGATSEEALVDVLVLPINDRPIPGSATLDTVAGATATVTLTATDPEGDSLIFRINTPPENGSAVLNNVTGELTYDANPGYTGPDVILWEVTDGELSAGSILPINIAADGDRDGVADVEDNCVDLENPGQEDVSNNGVGDLCDCYESSFADLDDDFLAMSDNVQLSNSTATSPPASLRLNGAGAYVETAPVPGCGSFLYDIQVAAGPPAPEDTDSLQLSARIDGGPWILIDEVFGTGNNESFAAISGQTAPITNLNNGLVEFRLEVMGDEPDDLFFVDDLSIQCDEDADFLADCFEATLNGFDLSVADADGDGVLDADEWANGSDPNNSDSDFDGFDDLADNCPVVANPLQTDDDNNGWGNACDAGVYDEFEGTDADPAMWTTLQPTGDGDLSTTNSWSGSQSLRMGLDSATILETNPMDLSECVSVGYNFKISAGTRGSYSYPFPGAWIRLEYNDGTAWNMLWQRNGHNRTYHDFAGIAGSTVDPNILTSGMSFRLITTQGGHAGDWFVDDFTIGCDSDGDTLPDVAERTLWGSNTVKEDTDLDGLSDELEVGIGSDPTDPNDAGLLLENEGSNNSTALADAGNSYSVDGPSRWYLESGLAENGAADFYRFDVNQSLSMTAEVVDIPDVMQCYSYYDVFGVYQTYLGYHRLTIYDDTGAAVGGPSWGYTSYDKYYCGSALNVSLSAGTYYVRVDNQYNGYNYPYALQVDFN